MNKLFYILIILININILDAASSSSDDITYIAHYETVQDIKISQALIDISPVLQKAVEWMERDGKPYIDLSKIGINADILDLLNKLVTNNLSFADFKNIFVNCGTLFGYLDLLLITENTFRDLLYNFFKQLSTQEQIDCASIGLKFTFSLMNNLIQECLLENYREYLFINKFRSYVLDKTIRDIDFVYSVQISPDSKYIVSVARPYLMIIWDRESGIQLKKLIGHTGHVNSVVISLDNKYIVSGSDDRTVRIWGMEIGDQLKILAEHINYVTSVAISSDNKYIISGSYDKTVMVWNIETEEILQLRGHNDKIHSVVLSSDSRYIVSGSDDNTVIIWDRESGNQLNVLKGHEDLVCSVAISKDNKYIISGSTNHTIIIWDMRNGVQLKNIKVYKGWSSFAITSDNKYIIFGSINGTIMVWNIESEIVVQGLQDHKGIKRVYISADAKYIVSCGHSEYLFKVWKFEESEIFRLRPLEILKQIDAEKRLME